MAEYYKGIVQQANPGAEELIWQKQKSWDGNDLKFSKISEVDATLDTSRFHISMPLDGTESYLVDHKYYQACEGEYFILNPYQQVRAEGTFKEDVQGLCFFITVETLAEVAQALHYSVEKVLDSPFEFPWQQQEFVVKTYRLHENSFGNFLMNLKNRIFNEIPLIMDWEVFYFELAAEFLMAHQQIGQHLRAIPRVQTLTKQEIYKRVSKVHGYILEKFEDPISLDELSKIALLSKYYIIKLYHQIYGKTPYQHILQLRIEKAKELLKRDESPTQIAFQLSFSDRRAFSKVFKKMVGISPSQFQQQ